VGAVAAGRGRPPKAAARRLALRMKRKFLRGWAMGRLSSKEARLLGREASPRQGSTCRADDGFIHHLAILVDADTDTLVKDTVIALD
jgi:hypothetical protein